ncbi:cyclase family protein, partial [Propionibacterium freudenreichii]|uniref:cyclase family protein n=1 Tax=Propionibacterium freudenreichii TaxID=1744 RepID=UPI00254A060B
MNTSNAQELPRAVDLSMLIEPHWRFGPEFGEKELEKPHFTFHSTLLRMAAHAFSHCDAPFHVSPDMETIDEMGLDRFFGPARMVDVSGHGDRAALGEKELREGGAAALQPGEIGLFTDEGVAVVRPGAARRCRGEGRGLPMMGVLTQPVRKTS